MKLVSTAAILTVLIGAFAIQPAHAAETPVSFTQIANGLDPMSNTSLGIKTFWQSWVGHRITWTGRVAEVKVGRTHQKVYLANSAKPTHRGYNVVLSISDYNNVAVLRKGQEILFSGNLNSYTARRGSPVIIELTQGAIKGHIASSASPEPAVTVEPAPATPTAEGELTFAQFVDWVDIRTNTKLAVRTHWANLKGRPVSWTGVVYDVKASRGRAEVYLANAAKPTYRGYNIVLSTYDIQGAAQLKKGQQIQFTGFIRRFSNRRGVPTVVTLGEGQIVAP